MDVEHEMSLVPLGDAYGDLECFQSDRIDTSFLTEPMLSPGESSLKLLKPYCCYIHQMYRLHPLMSTQWLMSTLKI